MSLSSLPAAATTPDPTPEQVRRTNAKNAIKAYWLPFVVTPLYGIASAVIILVAAYNGWPDSWWSVTGFLGGIALLVAGVAIDNYFVPSGGLKGLAIKLFEVICVFVLSVFLVYNNIKGNGGMLWWAGVVLVVIGGSFAVSRLWYHKFTALNSNPLTTS